MSNTEMTLIAKFEGATARSALGQFGHFPQGCITLTGHLCEMRVRKSPFEDFITALQVGVEKYWFPLRHPSREIHFDRPGPLQELIWRRVFFFPIVIHKFTSPESAARPGIKSLSLWGLLLQHIGTCDGQFKRVGMMEIGAKVNGDDRAEAKDLMLLLEVLNQPGSIGKQFYRLCKEDKTKYTIDIV